MQIFLLLMSYNFKGSAQQPSKIVRKIRANQLIIAILSSDKYTSIHDITCEQNDFNSLYEISTTREAYSGSSRDGDDRIDKEELKNNGEGVNSGVMQKMAGH